MARLAPRRGRALVALTLAALIVIVVPAAASAAPTSLTLNGSINAPFGGGPFGTIESTCQPGSQMTFNQNSVVSHALPDGFGSGTIQTSGSVTIAAVDPDPLVLLNATMGAASDVSVSVTGAGGNAVVTLKPSAAGRSHFGFSAIHRSVCHIWNAFDVTNGPIGPNHADCTTIVTGFRFDLGGLAGHYEALITPSNGDGAVIERGMARLIASYSRMRCTTPAGLTWNSTFASFNFEFRTQQRQPLDDQPPVVTGTPDRAANEQGWYRNDVTIDWTAIDPDPSSGAPTDPPNTVASIEGENVEYISDQSCDPAGNCGTGSLSLSIDKTDPSVSTPTVSPNQVAQGSSAIVEATGGDALSGLAGGEYFIGSDPGVGSGSPMSLSGSTLSAPTSAALTPGSYTVGVRSRDLAGNWSATATASFRVYDPGPSAVTLTPSAAVSNVSTTHSATASVTNVIGDPVANTDVLFTISGSVNTTRECTTDASGQCSISYTGPALPGADLVVACADSDGDGARDAAEPCGEATTAWILPTSTAGQVTGGGHVLNPQDGEEVAFGFTAKSDASGLAGNCTVVDKAPARNLKIKCLTVDTLVRSGSTATLFGQADVNGVVTTYRIDITDNGEPGRNLDSFSIRTGTGYSAGGLLDNGNVEVHN